MVGAVLDTSCHLEWLSVSMICILQSSPVNRLKTAKLRQALQAKGRGRRGQGGGKGGGKGKCGGFGYAPAIEYDAVPETVSCLWMFTAFSASFILASQRCFFHCFRFVGLSDTVVVSLCLCQTMSLPSKVFRRPDAAMALQTILAQPSKLVKWLGECFTYMTLLDSVWHVNYSYYLLLIWLVQLLWQLLTASWLSVSSSTTTSTTTTHYFDNNFCYCYLIFYFCFLDVTCSTLHLTPIPCEAEMHPWQTSQPVDGLHGLPDLDAGWCFGAFGVEGEAKVHGVCQAGGWVPPWREVSWIIIFAQNFWNLKGQTSRLKSETCVEITLHKMVHQIELDELQTWNYWLIVWIWHALPKLRVFMEDILPKWPMSKDDFFQRMVKAMRQWWETNYFLPKCLGEKWICKNDFNSIKEVAVHCPVAGVINCLLDPWLWLISCVIRPLYQPLSIAKIGKPMPKKRPAVPLEQQGNNKKVTCLIRPGFVVERQLSISACAIKMIL